MLTAKKQQGMTMIGWLFVLGLIGFFTILILRLWPIYYENMSVKRAVGRLPAETDIASKSRDQVWTIVQKQFTVDGVRRIKKEDLVLERTDDGRYVARIKYEVRVNVMFNVDAVVWFDEEAVLPQK